MKLLINTLTLLVCMNPVCSLLISAEEVARSSIKQTCDALVESCNVILQTGNSKKIEVLTDHPWESQIITHSEALVEIKSSCGSPCSFSIFVDLKSKEIESVSMPITFSKAYNLVAFSDGSSIKIKSLFKDKTAELKPDFSPTAALISAIKEADFISNSSLSMTYLSGQNYNEKTKVFNFNF